MQRTTAIICLVACLSAVAAGDELTLNDGRTFVGIVRTEGDNVLIQLPNATLSFPSKDVLHIEMKPTPEEEFTQKIASSNMSDPAVVYQLAQWAAAAGLGKHAQELYDKVIQLNPDHAEARKASGFIKVDDQWQTFDKAVEIVRGKLEAGQAESVLKDILPRLEGIAASREKLAVVRELLGQSQLRSKDFASAAKTFALLADIAEGAPAIRAAALGDILKENTDGMYVVTDSFPTTTAVMEPEKVTLKPGPASLADPLVVQSAIRDRAKKEIESGRKLMDSAGQTDTSDPDTAKLNYTKAAQFFDKADALVDGISRSYRVEIVRRRITAIRRDADAEAEQFDKAISKLGKQNMTAQEYQTLVLNLTHLLDSVRDNLQTIIASAKPYPRDLVLELKWAELDLKKIDGMRKVLMDEANGQK